MVDPVVRSALIVLVAFVLKQLADLAGLPLDTATLAAIATALVAWILGDAAANRLMARFRG